MLQPVCPQRNQHQHPRPTVPYAPGNRVGDAADVAAAVGAADRAGLTPPRSRSNRSARLPQPPPRLARQPRTRTMKNRHLPLSPRP